VLNPERQLGRLSVPTAPATSSQSQLPSFEWRASFEQRPDQRLGLRCGVSVLEMGVGTDVVNSAANADSDAGIRARALD
jgi:hypothetical protein